MSEIKLNGMSVVSEGTASSYVKHNGKYMPYLNINGKRVWTQSGKLTSINYDLEHFDYEHFPVGGLYRLQIQDSSTVDLYNRQFCVYREDVYYVGVIEKVRKLSGESPLPIGSEITIPGYVYSHDDYTLCEGLKTTMVNKVFATCSVSMNIKSGSYLIDWENFTARPNNQLESDRITCFHIRLRSSTKIAGVNISGVEVTSDGPVISFTGLNTSATVLMTITACTGTEIDVSSLIRLELYYTVMTPNFYNKGMSTSHWFTPKYYKNVPYVIEYGETDLFTFRNPNSYPLYVCAEPPVINTSMNPISVVYKLLENGGGYSGYFSGETSRDLYVSMDGVVFKRLVITKNSSTSGSISFDSL